MAPGDETATEADDGGGDAWAMGLGDLRVPELADVLIDG